MNTQQLMTGFKFYKTRNQCLFLTFTGYIYVGCGSRISHQKTDFILQDYW